MADDEPAELDLRGLKCPLPVLRTRRALRRLAAGSALIVCCDDPMAAIDLPHCLNEDGHSLVRRTEEGCVLTFHIRKRA